MSEVLLLKGNNLIILIRGGITMNSNNLIVKNFHTKQLEPGNQDFGPMLVRMIF
jgi:hypothetical protein